jgi:NADH:ubiquinone oxidoreductase subunit C
MDMGDRFEVLYTFEPREVLSPLKNIRVALPKEDTLPSISEIYNCAVIAENEMVGDFNIKISGMTLDFQGKLMRTKDSVQFPLTRKPPVPKTNMEEVKS